MKTSSTKHLGLLSLTLVALTTAACGSPNANGPTQSASQQTAPDQAQDVGLFTEAQAPTNLGTDQSPEEAGSVERYVRVNLGSLQGASQEAAIRSMSVPNGATLKTIKINLAPGRDVEVAIQTITPYSDSNYAFGGTVVGQEDSEVSLAMNDGVLAGTIRMGENETYTVQHVADGVHSIVRVDDSQELECANESEQSQVADLPEEMEALAVESQEDVLSPMAATPTIDVLVAYTPAARSRVGGTAAVKAQIQKAILDTNMAYQDSGVNLKVRLAGTMETKQNESGSFSADIRRLASKTDGKWDEVHRMREQLNADQVSLVGAYRSQPRVAGIAAAIGSSSASAFTVTRISAFYAYTFTHELGHNIGLYHEDGHVFGGRYRTIMNKNGRYTRIRRFSNPSIRYKGYVTGNGSHNEARKLNAKGARIANFR